MKEYVFCRKEFKCADEFYLIIKQRMNLPVWFGCNPDALWDMLIGHIALPCTMTLVGFHKEENEYNECIIASIIKCFMDAQKLYPKKFKINIVESL